VPGKALRASGQRDPGRAHRRLDLATLRFESGVSAGGCRGDQPHALQRPT